MNLIIERNRFNYIMLRKLFTTVILSIWTSLSLSNADILALETQSMHSFDKVDYPLSERKSSISPLHVAAAWGHVNIVRMLLATGSEIEQADANGNTALLYAAQEGHVEIVKMLLIAGANPVVENKFGATANALAIGHGHRAVIDELGEKPDRQNTTSFSNLWLWAIALITAAGIGTATLRRFTGICCDRSARIDETKRAFA